MVLERLSERGSLVHLLPEVAKDALELGLLDLIDERGERLDDGNVCTDERRELAGHGRDIFGRDALKVLSKIDLCAQAASLRGALLLLVHLRREDALFSKLRPSGLRVVRVDDAH